MDVIDLTLSQFGCPTDTSWSDTRQRYVVRMVGDQPDDVLDALAQHLNLGVDEYDENRLTSDFWAEGYFRLFISHLGSEKAYAHEFKAALAEFDVDPHGFLGQSRRSQGAKHL